MKTLLRFVRGISERVCLVVMGPSAVRYQLEAMMRPANRVSFVLIVSLAVLLRDSFGAREYSGAGS
jgi:hypothetical protein